jgi:nitrogen permease regulator 2-like protein
MFNLALVLDEDADVSAHASVVRKLARMFRNLEEQSRFLSSEEDDELWDAMSDYSDDESDCPWPNRNTALGLDGVARGTGPGGGIYALPESGQKVYALCEMILEDLNNYCECMIPIGRTSDTSSSYAP